MSEGDDLGPQEFADASASGPHLRTRARPSVAARDADASAAKSVRGVVRRKDGSAVAGVPVFACEWDPEGYHSPCWRQSTSDAQGRFSFDNLDEPLVSVLAYGKGHVSPELSRPHPWLMPLGLHIRQPCAHEISLVVESTVSVEGRVLDEAGVALAGCPVRAFPDYEGANWMGSVFEPAMAVAQTDRAGRFTLHNLIPHVSHRVLLPGSTTSLTIHPARDNVRVLYVTKVAEFRRRNRPLETADYTIAVVDASTGAAVSHATVALRAGHGFGDLGLVSEAPRPCDRDGVLHLTTVPALRYQLSVKAPGYLLGEGEVHAAKPHAEVSLKRGNFLRGRVFGPDGKPAGQFSVDVGMRIHVGVQYGDEGRFTVGPLDPDEEYCVEAKAPGEWRGASKEVGLARDGITLVLPAPSVDVVRRPAPPPRRGLRLDGRVVYEDGVPVPGVLVRARTEDGKDVQGASGDVHGWAMTSDTGAFELVGLDPRPYPLEILVPGRRTRVWASGTPGTSGLEVHVPRPVAVVIRVQDERRRPIAGIWVELWRADVHYCCSMHADLRSATDQAGCVPIRGLDPMAEYALKIYDPLGGLRGLYIRRWSVQDALFTMMPDPEAEDPPTDPK